ncbi:MAG: peptide ABC transporter ATP-binding protein [Mesorhizobium amorphae]|nr:MAG: peptide ABC transporter ATP-binding protein [Mesorhizobium amorphae]
MTEPLLSVSGLSKTFARAGQTHAAVDGVSFSLEAGETLALVGPSGSGKSTIARLLLRLVEPDAGAVRFAGEDWLNIQGAALRNRRRLMQAVFQDPLAAFNPRATVEGALEEPLRIHGLVPKNERRDAVANLLARVGLGADLGPRAIHEISGGQRQRVAIARALACQPQLVVLDEATSALDVSVRGRILDILADLQQREKLAYLFISHDLAAVAQLAGRVAVLNAGRIVETGNSADVISRPQSATAQALVAATPRLPKNPLP